MAYVVDVKHVVKKALDDYIELLTENYEIEKSDLIKLADKLLGGSETKIKTKPSSSAVCEDISKTRIVIRENKIIKKYWHKNSRMVFKSRDEKIVIGYLNDNNEILELTDETKAVCKKYGFFYLTDSFNSPKVNEKQLLVNVKVEFIRPYYQNLMEWMKDENNVYIARKGVVFIDGERFPKIDSLWANPFKVPDETEKGSLIDRYEVYIRKKIIDENLQDEVRKLKGKTLGCWCKPSPCHGDVLLKIIDEYTNSESMVIDKNDSVENILKKIQE